MKKIYVTLFLGCLTTTFVQAQFEKGQKALGGSIGFAGNRTTADLITNSYNYWNSSFTFSPSLAWFTRANKLNGIALSYLYSRDKNSFIPNDYSNTNRSNSIGAEYFSQRFLSLAPRLFFTVKGSIGGGYTFGRGESINANVTNSWKTIGFFAGANLAPGLSYKLSSRFLFDAYLNNLISLNYFVSKRKSQTSKNYVTYQEGFSVSSSLSNTNIGAIGLGFRWLLKK